MTIPVTSPDEPAPSAELAKANELFDMAEAVYADLFRSSGRRTTFSIDGYLARYYKYSDTYLGTQGDDVYVYGDVFGGLLYVGKVDDLLEDLRQDVLILNVHDTNCIDDVIAVFIDNKYLGNTVIGQGRYYYLAGLSAGPHTITINAVYSGGEAFGCLNNGRVTFGLSVPSYPDFENTIVQGTSLTYDVQL